MTSPSRVIPALLIKTSTVPNASTDLSNISLIESGLEAVFCFVNQKQERIHERKKKKKKKKKMVTIKKICELRKNECGGMFSSNQSTE